MAFSPGKGEPDIHAVSCPCGKAFTKDWTIVLIVINNFNLVEDFLVDERVGLGLEFDRRSMSIGPFIQCVAKLASGENW